MNLWARFWDRSRLWRVFNCEDGGYWRRFVDELFARLDAGCDCCTRTRVMLLCLLLGWLIG